jgi:hypothetical protein
MSVIADHHSFRKQLIGSGTGATVTDEWTVVDEELNSGFIVVQDSRRQHTLQLEHSTLVVRMMMH